MTTEVELTERLKDMQQRLESMEAERRAEQLARRRTRRVFTVGLLLSTLTGGGIAYAANGNCPNGLPYCFGADTPALASEVNHNFMQLKEWVEQKTGAVGNAAVRIQTGATSNVSTASGKALFVSGEMGDGSSDNGGIEFRHDNLTQGIGFGFNTIYATGSAADQHLRLKSRGANGRVILNGNTEVTNNLTVAGGTTTTGGVTINGDLVVPNNQHGTCYTTGYGCGFINCNNGYFMAGLDIGENEDCGGGGDFDYSSFALVCCKL
jgi:hypothetical protein